MAADVLTEVCTVKSPNANLVILPISKLKNYIARFVSRCEKTSPGLMISANTPAENVQNQFRKVGVNTKKIFFIDFVFNESSGSPRTENIIHLARPSDLTSLSIAISQFAEAVPGEKFVVIDTINTFLIYNSPNVLASFVHSLCEKANRYKIKLCVFATSENRADLLTKISPFFDNVYGLEPNLEEK